MYIYIYIYIDIYIYKIILIDINAMCIWVYTYTPIVCNLLIITYAYSRTCALKYMFIQTLMHTYKTMQICTHAFTCSHSILACI